MSKQANNGAGEDNFSMWIDGPSRKRGGQKRMCIEVVRMDLSKCNISEDLAQERLD